MGPLVGFDYSAWPDYKSKNEIASLVFSRWHEACNDIHLRPLCLSVSEQIVSGEESFKPLVDGTLLIYEARPNDHSYNKKRDCMAIEGLDEAAADVVRNLNG